MDEILKRKFKARATVLKALAHPSRLFIVDALSKKEHCVCELTEMIGADMSTVSKHLSVLKNAGIVESDKRGLKVYYTIRIHCVLNFFECAESVIESIAKKTAGECEPLRVPGVSAKLEKRKG